MGFGFIWKVQRCIIWKVQVSCINLRPTQNIQSILTTWASGDHLQKYTRKNAAVAKCSKRCFILEHFYFKSDVFSGLDDSCDRQSQEEGLSGQPGREGGSQPAVRPRTSNRHIGSLPTVVSVQPLPYKHVDYCRQFDFCQQDDGCPKFYSLLNYTKLGGWWNIV